jgi:sarcosine oxidase subunit beta
MPNVRIKTAVTAIGMAATEKPYAAEGEIISPQFEERERRYCSDMPSDGNVRQITKSIVIAGAGVIGCSIAWNLARRGCRNVTVIDRAPRFGEGSSGKATGGFRAQFADPIDIRLSLISREEIAQFPSETGRECGYLAAGYLFLATSEEELSALRAAQQIQHDCGLIEARMISAPEARAMNPEIGDERIAGAAFCPSDGFIRPMSLLEGYAEAARQLGVQFEMNVEVSGVEAGGGRILSLRTSQGSVPAAVFVNAMGAWAGAPVRALRRNALATIETDLLPPTTPMTIWAGDWFHMRVRDGRVLLLWPDDPPLADDQWFEQVLRFTRERLPRVADLPIAERWSGFYEMSPDEHALLGRSPQFENLYLATGSSGHGVMHAPALGRLLAELIVDGTTSIDITALDPARFRAAL